MTFKELERLRKAFKNEEFRNLFGEYVKEISDPKNRELYEKEIEALESGRGNSIRWVKPTGWRVLKTRYVRPPHPKDVPEGVTKVFVNVCSSSEISPGTSKKVVKDGKRGESWSIPYSLNQPRADVDHELAMRNPNFASLLYNSAVDGIERQFEGVRLSREWKTLKMRYKGEPKATVIRTKVDEPEPGTSLEFLQSLQAEDGTLKPSTSSSKQDSGREAPRDGQKKKAIIEERPDSTKNMQSDTIGVAPFTVIHSGTISYHKFTNEREKSDQGARPESLLVRFKLDRVSAASEFTVDTNEKEVVFESAGKYEKTVVSLPFEVRVEDAKAKFDRKRKELEIRLPVIPAAPASIPPSDAPFENEEPKDSQTPHVEKEESCDGPELRTSHKTENLAPSDDERRQDEDLKQSSEAEYSVEIPFMEESESLSRADGGAGEQLEAIDDHTAVPGAIVLECTTGCETGTSDEKGTAASLSSDYTHDKTFGDGEQREETSSEKKVEHNLSAEEDGARAHSLSSDETTDKKEKKSKREKKDKKRKHDKHASSDSEVDERKRATEEADDEWVELPSVQHDETIDTPKVQSEGFTDRPSATGPPQSEWAEWTKNPDGKPQAAERDWMIAPDSNIFRVVTEKKVDLRQVEAERKEVAESTFIIIDVYQAIRKERELNPYFSQGGSGLPEEAREEGWDTYEMLLM
ncbi:Protein kintoun [Phlyctochytrium bullatum]|nr:Protein kintoun [Phlyctochytrium bullatum]